MDAANGVHSFFAGRGKKGVDGYDVFVAGRGKK
jgi:hypothetical protein